jgi:hypothetical protein
MTERKRTKDKQRSIKHDRMAKGLESAYDKWNISMVICDTYSVTVNQVMMATVKLSK